jgi:hypothetical protein
MKLPPKGRTYLFVAMWKIQQAVVEKLLRGLVGSDQNVRQGKYGYRVPKFSSRQSNAHNGSFSLEIIFGTGPKTIPPYLWNGTAKRVGGKTDYSMIKLNDKKIVSPYLVSTFLFEIQRSFTFYQIFESHFW